jgi:RNA polymerase sigma-70 factor (ECF subfamily)
MADEPIAQTNPEVWVDEHGDTLYRYALMRLRDQDSAEEVVQETLLAGLKARERFTGRSSERTWLVGILKHKIVDHIRRRTRERPSSGADAAETLDHLEQNLFDQTGHWKNGPSDWLTHPDLVRERAEFQGVFAACLDGLPERMADAFSLRELDELDSATICKALGITETNLWVMLHRARLKLRGCLETHWLDDSAGEND